MSGGFRPGAQATGPRNGAFALVALVALAGGAFYVAFVLPARVAVEAPPATPIAAPAPPPTSPSPSANAPTGAPAAGSAERARAEFAARRGEAARKLVALEADGARIWARAGAGEPSLADGENALAKADAAATAGRFGDAGKALDAADTAFDALAQSKPRRFAAAMEAGRAALDNRAAKDAADAFAIALALSPTDPAASAGSARAAKLPEALGHLADGEAAVAAGDARRAREAYARALAVDPALGDARAKLADIDARLARQAYQSAVSAALDRLAAGDTRAAQDAIERARRLRPNAPEVADIGARIAARARTDELARARAEAEGHEAAERWRAALAAYDRALTIDPAAAFAARGRARAAALADLHAVIDRYLNDPLRLQSADPRAHAAAALDAARVEKMGPVLREKSERLAEALAAAGRPIPVTLRSDGNTAVEILRVGSFGAFASREVALPPGSYVAIGRRSGFRDVRVAFEVGLKGNAPLVEVACKDPLR